MRSQIFHSIAKKSCILARTLLDTDRTVCAGTLVAPILKEHTSMQKYFCSCCASEDFEDGDYQYLGILFLVISD